MPARRTPKYRRHKATGRGVVTLSGRDHYLPGKHGSAESRAAYARIVAEFQAAGGHRPMAAGERITIVEMLARYWNQHVVNHYVTPDGNASKEQNGVKNALAEVRKLYGRTYADEFGPLALRAVREAMMTARDRKLSRQSVNRNVWKIKCAFRWAVENELIPSSVIHGLTAVRGLQRGRCKARETEPIRPVADYLVDAILPHVSPVVASMIRLQRLTGMRSGELCIMRGCDIDRSGRIWTYTPETHKTAHHGHARAIYLGPQAQSIIRPYIGCDLTAYLFSPAVAAAQCRAARTAARKTPKSCGNVVGRARKRRPQRRPGVCYDSQSYGKAVARGCERAFPVPDGADDAAAAQWRRERYWHPHQLRHSAATRLRKEFGIEAARVVLGHRSALVTEIYAEIDNVRAAEIMAKVG